MFNISRLLEMRAQKTPTERGCADSAGHLVSLLGSVLGLVDPGVFVAKWRKCECDSDASNLEAAE